MFQSQARSQSPGDRLACAFGSGPIIVSISGEKPIPWRPVPIRMDDNEMWSFNLRREANPLATITPHAPYMRFCLFQSQARSQSPGDASCSCCSAIVSVVSISGEKPIPWRHLKVTTCVSTIPSFNLRREANPLATLILASRDQADFPVSISGEKPIPWRLSPIFLRLSIQAFQSQARSQSPGDGDNSPAVP